MSDKVIKGMAETLDEKAKPSMSARTTDGFANFAARLGVNPNTPDGGNNLTSQGYYIPNLITRNRLQLEYGYRGSWIVAKMINTVSEDMTRSGITITTNEGADQISDIEIKMSRLKVWSSICETLMWGRLYGGALGVMQIRGQKLDTPINLDSVGKDQFTGITPYDRWQVYPVLDKLINEGPDLGLPEYYDVVLGANMNNPGQEPGGQITDNPNGRIRIHHSRCIRIIGIKLPFWQAITEMLWGESVLEQLWDRLIEFDTATAAVGNLINRAQLRMIGVDGLREIFAAGGAAQEALIEMFEYIRKFQQNEGITLLDKNDTFDSVAYSFAGLADVLIQFGQQLSGASDIPLVRLFGQSPAGLSATGESDLRMYYDGILAKQEATLRNPLEVLIKVIWRSTTGKPAPKDMTFEFVPLWQMTATEKATIAKMITETILEVHESGLISAATALKELKEMSGDHGIFTHITDEEINEAESDLPPEPDMATAEVGSEPSAGTGNPGSGPAQPKELLKKATGDSAFKRIKRWLTGDAYSEKTYVSGMATKGKDSKPMTPAQKAIRDFNRSTNDDAKVTDPGVAGTMKEFYKGTLKSSSGKKVTSKKQAAAIGYSEEGEGK